MKKTIRYLSYSALCMLFFITSVSAQSINIAGPSGGGLKLGEVTGACDGSTDGVLHWNGTCFEGCISNTWACVIGGCDNTPDSFSFNDVSNASTSALTTSNIVQITGADVACNAVISVSGEGDPEWRLCSDSGCSTEIQTWTTSNSSEDTQGNYLQVRTTSPATTSTTHTVTINVGSTTNIWTVNTNITGSCGASPSLGDVCPDGTIYAGLTPDGNVPMYLARCDIGMSWSGSACAGTRSLLPWNDGNSSNRTVTGYRSSITGDLNTAGIITIDSDSGTAGTQQHQAAQACADLNVHGHTDWYMPSTREMWVIWDNLVEGIPNDDIPNPIVTGFGTTSYWTSSEGNDLFADFAALSTGNSSDWYGTNKNDTLPVRCARQD